MANDLPSIEEIEKYQNKSSVRTNTNSSKIVTHNNNITELLKQATEIRKMYNMNNSNDVSSNNYYNNENSKSTTRGKIDVLKILKETSYMRNNNENNYNYDNNNYNNYLNSNRNNYNYNGGSTTTNSSNNNGNGFGGETSRVRTLRDLQANPYNDGSTNYNSNNSPSTDVLGQKCLAFTNDFRKKNGLRPLT